MYKLAQAKDHKIEEEAPKALELHRLNQTWKVRSRERLHPGDCPASISESGPGFTLMDRIGVLRDENAQFPRSIATSSTKCLI